MICLCKHCSPSVLYDWKEQLYFFNRESSKACAFAVWSKLCQPFMILVHRPHLLDTHKNHLNPTPQAGSLRSVSVLTSMKEHIFVLCSHTKPLVPSTLNDLGTGTYIYYKKRNGIGREYSPISHKSIFSLTNKKFHAHLPRYRLHWSWQ